MEEILHQLMDVDRKFIHVLSHYLQGSFFIAGGAWFLPPTVGNKDDHVFVSPLL